MKFHARHTLLLMGLILILLGLGRTCAWASDVSHRSDALRLMMVDHDFPAAVRELEAIKDPTLPDLYYLGRMCFAMNLYDKAEDAYNRLLKLDSGNPEVLCSLAQIHLIRYQFYGKNPADLAAASARVNQAITYDATYPLARNQIAMVLMEQDKLDEAEKIWKDLLLDPSYRPLAQENLGELYRRRHEFLKANESLQSALVEDQGNPILHIDLARLYLDMGSKDRARTEYGQAVTMLKAMAYPNSTIIAAVESEMKGLDAVTPPPSPSPSPSPSP